MSNELQNTNLELSDDDLENVAGGTSSPKTYHPHGQVGIKNSGSFTVNGGTVTGISNF